ncbi:hypothetical protein DL98DRAFT_633817 [Cadophora sp. DSE1049]|nr:hypothetical protein DL98DRAFT_633817 [Cadophora sp. DSE1049]
MAPHVYEIELGRFENAPAKIEDFCKFAQDKWRGTTYSNQSVREVLEEYKSLFNEQFEAYEEFMHLLTDLRKLRDDVKKSEPLTISEVHTVSIEPQEVAGEGKEKQVSAHGNHGDLELAVPSSHTLSGETDSSQQHADVVVTNQKENRQIKDKLNDVVIQVQENAVVEKDNPTETNGVLAPSTNQQDNRQPENRLNGVFDQLQEAAAEKDKPMEADGVLVPTKDGAQLIPAVDPITVNSVQLPNLQSLGFPSTKQLQELNDTQPLPGIKTLGFPSTKQLQEWKETNVTTPLPSINKLLDGKKLRDSRKSIADKTLNRAGVNKPSARVRPEASDLPPAKVPRLTKTTEDTASIQPVRTTGQAKTATSQGVATEPKVTELSDEARKLQAQWRTRVDALHDILLNMQPTGAIDNRTLFNVISTFFWQKKDLFSFHKWKSCPEYTCLRRLNRLNYEDPGKESISPNVKTTKCSLCRQEGSKCVQVKGTEGSIEFRAEP